MSPSPEMRRFRRWVTTSWIGLVLSCMSLFFGLMATGAGHGTYGLWYLGLVVSFISWLLVLISVLVGRAAIQQSSVWGLVWGLQLVLWLILTGVGIWGIGG